jgi:hypothetical protein
MFNKTHYNSIRYGALTLLLIMVLEAIVYLGFFKNIPDFLAKYAWWIFYLDISIVSIGICIHYMMSHKTESPCMMGMMTGMTIAMQTGMMIGAVLGATNGFFIGSMVGMILGSIGGILAGRISRSTMSWVQGLMAGIMGGTMGPMISLMMFTDHILLFMPFYFILNLIVLAGFMKMYHEELVKDNDEMKYVKIDMLSFVSASIIITALLLVLMIYGWKSPLFGYAL